MIGRCPLALTFAASMANASPIDPGHVEVLDGDTIRIAGETFRLVRDARLSVSWAIERHSDFGSSWLGVGSSWSASRAPARPELKERDVATMAARAERSTRGGRTLARCCVRPYVLPLTRIVVSCHAMMK